MSGYLKFLTPQRFALCSSILLSLWVWIGGSSINTDGVVYLEAAQQFAEKGLADATAVYDWPFYPILIAATAKLGLSLEAAAQLLNVIFFAALAWGFVKAVELLYPNRIDLHYLGAAIILLVPRFNALRPDIYRDNGFLAGVILSLVALLSYARSGRPRILVAWLALIAVATLFRAEAIVLLAAGVVALTRTPPHRRAGLIAAALGLIGTISAFFLLTQYMPQSRLNLFIYWWKFYTRQFIDQFMASASLIESSVLGQFSNDYGKEGLLAILFVIFAGTLLNALTPVHALALYFFRKEKSEISASDRKILWIYGVAAAIPPTVFILQYHFLAQRYILALVLILLLLAPIRLLNLLTSIRQPQLKVAVIILISLFFAISNWRNLAVETELKDAGVWLAKQQGSVWTNSAPISFYVRQNNSSRSVTAYRGDSWERDFEKTPIGADWTALVIADRNVGDAPLYAHQLNAKEICRFKGKRRWVIVFQRNTANAAASP